MATEKAPNVPPFVRFCSASVPMVFDNSMSYYECLCALTKFIQDLVNTVNYNATQLDGLQEGFKELKDYVDNYFATLDVQEEINNKLDEMAEGGQLAGIIAQFLAASPVFAYHTIADMAAATNLSNGTIARVIGNTSATDGDGAYYLIRTVDPADDPDGVNLVAIGDTLVGVRVNDGNLDAAVTSINASIEDLNDEIEKINARKTHNTKFVGNDEPYYPECKLSSNYNAIDFEPFVNRTGTAAQLSIQGVSLWKRTGKLVFNNGTQIYTLKQANNPAQSVLFSGSYGHGGDSCILADDLYIADSENTAIYKVDLNNGNKTTYSIPAASIKNATENYTPVLSGVCADEQGLLYIVACDPENNDHTIKSNSTVRIYSFNTNTNEITKLYEMTQDTCYVQGMTKDAEFFYIAGNKPFSGSYAGSIMTIIKAEGMTFYDKISNNSDYEFEGLDYGCFDGVEGIITVCAKYGVYIRTGVYSFYGNCSKQRTLFNTETINAYSTKSRDGVVKIFFTITDDFAAGEETYSYENFFENAYPNFGGGGSSDFAPISLAGSTRYFDGYAIWDYNNTDHPHRLRIFVKSGSQASTKVTGMIEYRSN